MSDSKSDEERQQQMEEIFICADVLLGAFAFLDPFELGLKMALISDRLDVLVDVHFKSREWSFGSLRICRANDGNGAEIVKRSGERLPIPQGPLPGKVIGFERIEISYVDQTVLEFIQRFRRLFDSSGPNVYIGTSINQSRSWEIIRQNIWPLVSHNICGLSLDPSDLDRLRQISPTILRNCANLRSIQYIGSFLAFPAEDNAAADFDRAMAKWLITPRGDGLPKMFHSPFYSEGVEGVERVKGSFVSASEPVNFIISFFLDVDADDDLVPFKLKNNWTREQLTFRQIDKYKWLLVRCPIEREEDIWTNWEKEAIELDWDNHWNVLIRLFDSDIGGGLVEANEGPSEPNE